MVTAAADGKAQLAILRTARVLVDAAAPASAEEEVPEWLRTLIAAQARLHERMGASGDARALSRAAGVLEGCLKFRPHLLGVYLDVLAAEDRSCDSLVALSAVTAFALALPSRDGESLPFSILPDLNLLIHVVHDRVRLTPGLAWPCS